MEITFLADYFCNHTLNISEYLTEYEEDKQEVLFCLFDPNLVMSCSC